MQRPTELQMGSVRKSKFLLTVVISIFLLYMIPNFIHGQGVGAGSASATIVTPLSVTADTPLKFGNVSPGVPKKVNRTAAGVDTTAAIFTVSGEDLAGISIQFILPQYMYNSSGDQMQIIFANDDCTIDSLAGTPDSPGAGAWVGENPYSLSAANIGATNGSTSIYLGGKIVPSLQQPAGSYSGDIVISVAYDGT